MKVRASTTGMVRIRKTWKTASPLTPRAARIPATGRKPAQPSTMTMPSSSVATPALM